MQNDDILKSVSLYLDKQDVNNSKLSRIFNELKDDEKDDQKSSDNEDENKETDDKSQNKKAKNEETKKDDDKSQNQDDKDDEKDNLDNEEDNQDDKDEDKKSSSKADNSYEVIIQKLSNSFQEQEKAKLKAYNSVSSILGNFNPFGLSEREILTKGLVARGIKVSNESIPQLYAMLKVLNSVKIDNSFNYSQSNSSLEEVDFNF
nr:MAG TPA: hypothetical protein [Caudoviricetes sp.]